MPAAMKYGLLRFSLFDPAIIPSQIEPAYPFSGKFCLSLAGDVAQDVDDRLRWGTIRHQPHLQSAPQNHIIAYLIFSRYLVWSFLLQPLIPH
jgi:hypothetical protein